TGLPVEVGSGGLTKFNRKRLGISKSNWSDAACVSQSTPNSLNLKGYQPLLIKAMEPVGKWLILINTVFPEAHLNFGKNPSLV
ncbi:hypothetical protein LKK83_05085, partial [Phormidium sp. CCY1219]|nr:hypothetical protein [Phormidium sp. CCY1219]